MHRSVWFWLLWLMVLGFPWLLARKGLRRDIVAISLVANLLCASTYALLVPFFDRLATAILIPGMLGLNLAVRFASPAVERRLLKAAGSRPALVLTTVLAAGLVPLGLVEMSCRLLTDLHVLNYHRGIQTVWRSGRDDWRLATITGDQDREPDPILLWRPAAHKPFNSQRFKGPLTENPKPADVVRIMCYGDSLTDGPPKGGWPSWFQVLLNDQPPIPGRRFEVINAGVAGYTSHQGLMRFLQDVDQYRPDLLLVSFGWNDAADAIGQPDKSFQIPPWPLVMCQRVLIHYRAYLVAMYYSRTWRAQPPVVSTGPQLSRVSVADYLGNLDRFRIEAQNRGIPIAVLTRPHKLPPDVLSQSTTWRGSVPRYNAALAAWAQHRNVPVIDAQGYFQELPDYLFSDECHFTTQGYEHLAKLVRAQLVTNPDHSPPLGWSDRPSLTLSPPFEDPDRRAALRDLTPSRR
jgi:lysophospholipase L1-like esterase